jgi:predicted GH43/DUF377 family glycosyl hydrolase
MWYIFGVQWISSEIGKPPERVYKIAHATSVDGIEWVKEGRLIISDKLNNLECQALPTVIEIAGVFHMFFCYREAYDFRNNSSRGYKIGYAFSNDLINWTRDDSNSGVEISDSEWDSKMQCYPHIFKMNENYYLLYNGNDFGRFGFGVAKMEL